MIYQINKDKTQINLERLLWLKKVINKQIHDIAKIGTLSIQNSFMVSST